MSNNTLKSAADNAALKTKTRKNIVNNTGRGVGSYTSGNLLGRNYQNMHRSKPILNSFDSIESSSVYEDNIHEEDDAGLTNSDQEIKGKGIISGLWKKSSLKFKLIIIGVVAALISLVMFLVVLITPLMELGIIDIEGISGSISGGSSSNIDYGYSSVSGNASHWVPIGSNVTTVSNGVTFAGGAPAVIKVTSYFKSKEDFRTNSHGGVDFGNGGNGPGVINVIASKSGRVTYPTSSSQTSFNDNGYYGNPDGGGFGNYVMIQHNDGTTTVYAHLSKDSITVMAGDNVIQGQVIGKMGHSGSSTGTHLHFEVRYNGSRQDPMNYINISNPRSNYSYVS